MTSDTPATDAMDASITDFVTVLIREFGGPADFAREVQHEYSNLPEGSPARARLLGLIVQMWAKHGAESMADDPDELQEELELLRTEEVAAQ